MANNESNDLKLSADLLNDFYAECDEHLNNVRQCLIQLEQTSSEGAESQVIEKLFRSFHSLKGIIGMVGIGPAEQLAHRTEDYLRDLSKNRVALTIEGTDLLARAAHTIEQTVASFRENQPLPDLRPVLADFERFIPGETPQPPAKPGPVAVEALDEALRRKIEDAAGNGFSVWKCAFLPSAALNQRGVNVNQVRERLSQSGDILHAAPHISEGAMVFIFFVALQEPPQDLEQWKNDGITFEQVSSARPGVHPPPPEAAPAPSNLFVAPSQVVRVDLSRLNELMRVAGELVIQRARLEEQINRLEANPGVDTRGLHEVNLGFGRHFKELRETVIRLRMVPIAEIFDRLPFVVRDLTRGTAKKVKMEIRGQQTEMDKFVVEQLKDPLLHLVRNAISHGIEDPDERLAAGKPAEATLILSAKTSGETVVIEIRDDGRGVDREKVAKRAREMGKEVSDSLDDVELLELICLPGFSTREEADRAAGRGVGMAVVQNTLRELGGTLSLDETKGEGTRFTLRLPLTLLITDALIISAAGQQFAVPQSSVEEVLHIEEANVKRIEHAELVSVRGNALPLVRLNGVFGFPKSSRSMPSVLVSQTERGRVGLVVDRIVGQRQVVVRSLRDPLIHVPGVIGATELGDGRPLLILDPLILSRENGHRRAGAEASGGKN